MTIKDILVSLIEIFSIDVDLDMDAMELVKTIHRAREFSARFTRIHLYQLQRQLYDLKKNILVNSEQPHSEVLAARVLALHCGILRALQIVRDSLRRYRWGQPLLALLDLLLQSTKTCQLLPSTGNAKEVGLLCLDDIPALCEKLKSVINTYQSTVQEIVRENEFYESPRSYWKMRRKSHGRESIIRKHVPDASRKHKKCDKCMSKVKQTTVHPGSFCNHNIGKIISDGPQNYSKNHKTNQSDRENDNGEGQINKQISARPSEAEPDRTSLQIENQQADDAGSLKSASATLNDGGGASAHLAGQQAASHVRSRVQGSNVLLVCIEESQGQWSSENTRGQNENFERDTGCHADLDSDSGNLWRLIGQAADTIVDEMLQSCMKELQLEGIMSHWLDDVNTHS